MNTLPSIFKLIREQIPNAKTCMYYDWDGLGDLINHKYIDKIELTKHFEETFSIPIYPSLSKVQIKYIAKVGVEI